MSEKLQVIQIGLDVDVFNEKAAQDSRQRQISYAKYLKKENKNLHLTNIVLTDNVLLKKEHLEDVTFIPCNYYRVRQLISLAIFLRKIHKDNKILLITTQDIHGIFWGAVLFSRLAKVPVIGQIHYDLSSQDAREELLVKLHGRLYEKMALRLIPVFDGIRVVNTATKKFLQELNYRNAMCVCPVPVTTAAIKQTENGAKWNYPGALRVLFVGRFVHVKNLGCWLDTASKALSVNKNIEFALIGDGEEKRQLEQYCEQLGIRNRVQFVGALRPEQVQHWYASADVLLLVSKHEGFGRVVVEAMNYKVVPVCTNVSGPKDIVEHGVSGYLDDEDPERLAGYLTILEKNRAKLKSMGTCAKNTVNEKYQPDKLTSQWLDYLLSFDSRQDRYKS